MTLLKALSFQCDDDFISDKEMWLSTNVDFIYSCVLVSETARSDGIKKINVYLTTGLASPSAQVNRGVANVYVSFNRQEDFQASLVEAATAALTVLGGRLDFDPNKMSAAVLETGFEYDYFPKPNVKHPRGVRIFIRTQFGKVNLMLDVEGHRYNLGSLWPSPWLFLISFLGARIEEGKLLVEFLHSDVKNPLFPFPYVSTENSQLAFVRCEVLERESRKVDYFEYLVP